MKTGKKLGEVEDLLAPQRAPSPWSSPTTRTSCLASTLGRVWAVDYEKGRVEPDIDKIPTHGDPPISGPVVFSNDGQRFAVGVVGEQYTTYGVRVYEWPDCAGYSTPSSATPARSPPCVSARTATSVASGAQDTSVLQWDLRKQEANDSRAFVSRRRPCNGILARRSGCRASGGNGPPGGYPNRRVISWMASASSSSFASVFNSVYSPCRSGKVPIGLDVPAWLDIRIHISRRALFACISFSTPHFIIRRMRFTRLLISLRQSGFWGRYLGWRVAVNH